ncbi:MAG: hypothetical protein ABL994_20555, partial [Verrucomicrobiales bacterium]
MQTNTPNQTNPQAMAASPTNINVSPHGLAALGYFCGIAAVVALVADPYRQNEKSRFHAIQALAFQMSWIGGYVLISMGTSLLSLLFRTLFVSHAFGLIGLLFLLPSLILGIYSMTMLIVWLYLIASSASGKDPVIPLLGNFAADLSNPK